MAGIEVTFDWSGFRSAIDRHFVGGMHAEHWPAIFPNTIQRMQDLANEAEARWKRKAMNLPGQEGRPLRLLPYVRLSQTAYAQSIIAQPLDGSGMRYVVGTTDEQADYVEEGSPGGKKLDFHGVLPTAPKARISKAGHRYLRVPFRHATTAPGGPSGQRFQRAGATYGDGVLSPGVIRAMSKKRQYLVTGRYTEPSISPGGGLVERFRYTPRPGRLTRGELQQINARSRRHRISETDMGRLVGLMRTGAKGHGQYLTIRTISEASLKGWCIPAYAPHPILQETVNELNRLVEGDYFEEAMRADANRLAEMVSA